MKAYQDIFDKAHVCVERCRKHNSKQPCRAALCFAWWGLLHCIKREKVSSGVQGGLLRVALNLDGGIGDILLHIRYVRDLCSQCGPFSLDIYSSLSPNISKRLFGDIEQVNNHMQGKIDKAYDLVLYSLFLPMTVFCDDKRIEKLASPALKNYIKELENFKDKNPLWFSQQEYFMADILNYARILKISRASLPYIIGNIKPNSTDFVDFKTNHLEFPWGKKSFVTISRGSGAAKNSTKLWQIEYYNELISLLREKFPNLVFVQTGHQTEQQLNTDYDLRGKTSFEEFVTLMKRAVLHISSEGGTVHLRHLLRGGPSAVFFGPTDRTFYGYATNCNIRSKECAPCEWAQCDWQKNCVRGFKSCKSMDALLPEIAYQQIINHPAILEALCNT